MTIILWLNSSSDLRENQSFLVTRFIKIALYDTPKNKAPRAVVCGHPAVVNCHWSILGHVTSRLACDWLWSREGLGLGLRKHRQWSPEARTPSLCSTLSILCNLFYEIEFIESEQVPEYSNHHHLDQFRVASPWLSLSLFWFSGE